MVVSDIGLSSIHSGYRHFIKLHYAGTNRHYSVNSEQCWHRLYSTFVSTHNITQNKQNTVHNATMQTAEDWQW